MIQSPLPGFFALGSGAGLLAHAAFFDRGAGEPGVQQDTDEGGVPFPSWWRNGQRGRSSSLLMAFPQVNGGGVTSA